MKQQIKKILGVVTSETLEKLAFLFAFADEELALQNIPRAIVDALEGKKNSGKVSIKGGSA